MGTCPEGEGALASGASCQFSCNEPQYTIQGGSTSCHAGVLTLQTCGGGPAAATINRVEPFIAGDGTLGQRIYFTPGDNRDSIILNYQLTIQPGNILVNATESPFVVRGLPYGVAFSHSMVSVVSFGTGAPSSTITCYSSNCNAATCTCQCRSCRGVECRWLKPVFCNDIYTVIPEAEQIIWA